MSAADARLRSVIGTMALALRRRRLPPSRLERLSRADRECLGAALGWNASANVVGLGIGAKRTDGRVAAPKRCLMVMVATKLAKSRLAARELVPPTLWVESLGRRVTTDVIEVGGIPQFQDGPSLRPGSNAAHFTMRDGTLTAVVRTAGAPLQPLLLSCSHTFAPPDGTSRQVESPPDPSAMTFGNWVANTALVEPLKPGGTVVNRMDAALAVPIPDRVGGLRNVIPGLGPVTSLSTLQSGEFGPRGISRFLGVGAMTPRVTGRLLLENAATVFRDSVGRVFLFQDLVAYAPTPETQAGDSGMPLLRQTPEGWELLGMHLGVSRILGAPNPAPVAFFAPISLPVRRFGLALWAG